MAKTIKGRRKLSSLETKCVTKFYFTDGAVISSCSSKYFRNLGIEKGLELIISLAETEPIRLKVIAHNEQNFTLLFDKDKTDEFTPIFIMKNGIQEL